MKKIYDQEHMSLTYFKNVF